MLSWGAAWEGLSAWSLGRPLWGLMARYRGCWSLVPSALGCFPQSGGNWASLGHVLGRLWQAQPGAWAGEDLSHPELHLPLTEPAPRLTANLPRGSCPDPPHHKHSLLRVVPRRATSLGMSSCPLCFPWTLLGHTEPWFPSGGGIPSILHLGLLGSPPLPSSWLEPAQGSLVILLLPPPYFWGIWKASAPNSPACLFPSWGLWHSWVLDLGAAYLSLNRGTP